MSAVLTTSDFLRTPVLATAHPVGFKEWHHFVVHTPDYRVLINFSLTTESAPDGGVRLVPRVIVIVHGQRWTGGIDRFAPSDVDISADLGGLTIGANRLDIRPDGYRVVIDLPGHGICGTLELVSVSRPFVVNNQQVGEGRMSWLFVPRLRADGWLRVDERQMSFAGAAAYHDHNWGRFWWGCDFGWTWGTIVPTAAENPWSLVYLQMTDRRRLHCLSSALYVWHRDEPAAIFRHAAVKTRAVGLLDRPADCTLPAAMRLLLGGEVPGVPERLEITAARACDSVQVEFRSASYARLAYPSETRLDRTAVLCETTGTVRVSGSVGGRDVGFTGAGVFEFLHG
jgi:hypothetical protein